MSKDGSFSSSSAVPRGGPGDPIKGQTQPNANSNYINPPLPSIACLHLYAHLTGRYPKLGLFCNDDLEVDLVGHSLSQPERPSDRDENAPAPACRPKDHSQGAKLEMWGNFKSASENATWLGVERAVSPLLAERVNKRDRNTTEGSIPIVAGPGQPSTPRTSYRIVEDSADEAEGSDSAFSGQDSDHEYIPGSTRRAKRTKVRGKESKAPKNGRGVNPLANSIGSPPEANTTIVKHLSTYHKRRNPTITEGTNDAILAASESTKKRKLVEESADEAFDGFGKYPAYDGSRSGHTKIDNPGRTPNPRGKNLQHSRKSPNGSKTGARETATSPLDQKQGKRCGVDIRDESSGISDDSDEDYVPGPRTKNGLKKSEVGGAISSATRANHEHGFEKTNQFGQTSTSNYRRHKVDIEPRGADGPLASGTRSTISKSEVQGAEDLSDLPDVVRASGGRYLCLTCGQCTKSKGDMKRHLQTIQHQVKSYVCPECLSTFTRKDSLKRHIKRKIRIRRTAYRVR